MEIEHAKEQIFALREQIEYHNDLYYNQDSPELDDYEYDQLTKKLKQLESQFPALVNESSPTKKVGGEACSVFSKVSHAVKMESLQDVFSMEEVSDFIQKLKEDTDFVVEKKIDGLSVSLEYQQGKFVRGSTRGDGLIGEDITQNLLQIKQIPKKIPFLGNLEVRGEVYMPKKVFSKLVQEQIENEETPFKNPRNAAAGSLRQKDSAVTKERQLSVFIFNVQQIEGEQFKAHSQSLDWLSEQGFVVSPSFLACRGQADVIKEIERIGQMRNEFEFDIDGAVVKVDDLAYRDRLGSTSKFPKWAVAFKYPPEEKQTMLLEIEINVGRTGKLTPTAIFEPILLAGTSVSRAVLHNQDFIDKLQISVGDTIVVRKAGDIIPEVVKVVKKGQGKPYKIPENCPSCGTKTNSDLDVAAVICPNLHCPARLYRGFVHFASRDAMNIDGLGRAIISSLINQQLICDFSDLYQLTFEQLLSLDGFKEKSANNLLAAIEKSKQNDPDKLLFGLGIAHVGKRSAQLLMQHFLNFDALMSANEEELSAIDTIGPIMAKEICQYFSQPKNQALVQKLKELGLNFQAKNKIKSMVLDAKKFVVTGTLNQFTRSEIQELITENGGKVAGSVSKATSFVIAGEEAGSKLTKANSLGIAVISEQEFLNMISHTGGNK